MEAAACAKELTATLKKRMLLHKEEAAECIQMLRKLGEPVEALQACAPAMCAEKHPGYGASRVASCMHECALHLHFSPQGGLALLAAWLGIITAVTCT